MNQMNRCMGLGILMAASVCASVAQGQMKDVPHPFILWTKQEAAALRKRIETDPMAKKQYENMANTGISKGNRPLWNLFNYAVMGDKAAGEAEKKALLGFIGRKPEPMTWNVDLKTLKWNVGMPSAGDRHMRDEQTLNTLRYDVLYGALTPEQRRGVEKAMHTYIQFHLDGHKPWHPAFKYDRASWLPNMHWPRAIGTQLMAVALKDEKLIDAMFNSQGGWKWFFDGYISDGRFYNEEFGKYYSNIGTMLTYCEALERLGLAKYGYGYTGKGGATMKKFLEMFIWIGFPRQDAPAGLNRYACVSMGDAGDTLFVDNMRSGQFVFSQWWSNSHMNGPLAKVRLPGWFEVGHRRWPDAGFGYFLAQLRPPGRDVYLPSLYWGLSPIGPREVKPPSAPSTVSRERGFALLRADETPAYWESSSPAVALQFGMYYVHYVHDCFSILGYQALNRMLYWRMGTGDTRGYAGGDVWRDHVRGHCGVVVDGLKANPSDDGNEGCKNHRIRDNLAPVAKFAAAKTQGVYPDVTMERALVLTKEYLFDLFWLKSDKPRVYDWQILAWGHIQGWKEGPWKAIEGIAGGRLNGRDVKRPHLQQIHVMDAGGKPWAVTLLQERRDVDPAKDAYAKAWNERRVGVEIHMLGEDGTLVLGSKPPGHAENALGASVLVTRQKPETVFAALHEPFEGGPARKPATKFERIQQNGNGIAVAVVGGNLNDRLLLAYGEDVENPLTLEGNGEKFTFTGYGFIRLGADKVEVTGNVQAFKIRVKGSPRLVVEGKEEPARVAGGYLEYEAR